MSAVHGRPSGSRYYVVARFGLRALGKVLGPWEPGLAGAKSRLDLAEWRCCGAFVNTTAISFDISSRIYHQLAADAETSTAL